MKLGLATLWCCLATACASDKDTVSEQHRFEDSLGRSCTATLEKTSKGSRSIAEGITCHEEPHACSRSSHPCFGLNPKEDDDVLTNCAACCKGASKSYALADCSPLVCEKNADCVYARATCDDGVCHCKGGVCE